MTPGAVIVARLLEDDEDIKDAILSTAGADEARLYSGFNSFVTDSGTVGYMQNWSVPPTPWNRDASVRVNQLTLTVSPLERVGMATPIVLRLRFGFTDGGSEVGPGYTLFTHSADPTDAIQRICRAASAIGDELQAAHRMGKSFEFGEDEEDPYETAISHLRSYGV